MTRYVLARTVNPRRAKYEFRRPANRKKSLRDHKFQAVSR